MSAKSNNFKETEINQAIETIIKLKQTRQQSIAVIIPARNEELTVGKIIKEIKTHLMDKTPLIDELVLVDDHSEDKTYEVAENAGATVVRAAGKQPGKGQAIAYGISSTKSELLIFLDADVKNFSFSYVVELASPILKHPEKYQLVKAYYKRVGQFGSEVGGRVTELVAKPLIAIFYPELCFIKQPLAGETAVTRKIMNAISIPSGFGFEIGLLLDVYNKFGKNAIAQVDLGKREHKNRPLDQLSSQAAEVMATFLQRAIKMKKAQLTLTNSVGEATLISLDEIRLSQIE